MEDGCGWSWRVDIFLRAGGENQDFMLISPSLPLFTPSNHILNG